MLVEQVLHIMLNQDYLRSLCFFGCKYMNFCITLYYGKMENMGKSYTNVCKTIVSTL